MAPTSRVFQDAETFTRVTAGGVSEHQSGDLSDFRQFVLDVLEHARISGQSRVLLDCRAMVYPPPNAVGDLAIHQMAGEMVQLGFSVAVTHLAYLVTQERFPDTRFAEDIFQNRGINIRYFDDEAQAVAWLTE